MNIYLYGILQIGLLVYFSIFIFEMKEIKKKNKKTFYIICIINVILLLFLHYNININIFDKFYKLIFEGGF